MTPSARKPRVFSPFQMTWLLRLYPPLLWSRVHVVRFAEEFRTCSVEVRRSLLTRNLHGTTFGGSIFSGADPFHAILYWQCLAREGRSVQTWLKRAAIDYRRPARTTLTLEFELTEADLAAAREALDRDGRHEREHTVDAIDREGRICATIRTTIHLRYPRAGQREASGF